MECHREKLKQVQEQVSCVCTLGGKSGIARRCGCLIVQVVPSLLCDLNVNYVLVWKLLKGALTVCRYVSMEEMLDARVKFDLAPSWIPF